MKYVCAWCGTFAHDHRVDIYDNGTTLTCNECKEVTIVDLDRPGNRTARYEALEDARAAGFAEGIEAVAKIVRKHKLRHKRGGDKERKANSRPTSFRLQQFAVRAVEDEIRVLLSKKEATDDEAHADPIIEMGRKGREIKVHIDRVGRSKSIPTIEEPTDDESDADDA